MLRKLNFTERAKIPRTHVRVTLRRDDDGVLVFDPLLSFEGVDVIPSARVFIEAYYRTSFMRFDCGSVGSIALPENRRLTEIDGTGVVRFRVKLVDNTMHDHRVIAVADDVIVSEEKPEPGGRMALLPVNFSDALGEQPWRVAFEPNGPVLELNNRIEEVRNVARNDAMFFALVYPAVVREILTHILLVERHDATEEGGDWWSLWLRWAARFAPGAFSDEESASFWIDDAVAAFCNDRRVVERWRAAGEETS
jgi:hypothetical protein